MSGFRFLNLSDQSEKSNVQSQLNTNENSGKDFNTTTEIPKPVPLEADYQIPAPTPELQQNQFANDIRTSLEVSTLQHLNEITTSSTGTEVATTSSDTKTLFTLETALRAVGVKESHIRIAVAREKNTNEALTDIMYDFAFLSQEKIAQVSAMTSGLPYFPTQNIDLIDGYSISKRIALQRYEGFVPIDFAVQQGLITVAVSDERQINTVRGFFPNHKLTFVIASQHTIQTIYRKWFSKTSDAFENAVVAFEQALKGEVSSTNMESTPKLLANAFLSLIRHACYQGCSDFAIAPTEMGGVVRLKIGGVGYVYRYLERQTYQAFINHFVNNCGKADVLSVEPVEGKIDFFDMDAHPEYVQVAKAYEDIGQRYGFRVEIIQTRSIGVSRICTVVVRLLDRQSNAAEFEALEFDSETSRKLKEYSQSKTGLVLVTGPTGSGKTTTLYAMIKQIDPTERWIQTIENPIEYRHGLWFQYEVPKAAGEEKGAAKLLKGLLRNAPDVCLVGEVRDAEVGNILLELSNTGHLVFSTLHNNNAALALTRLKNFGLDMYGLASVLQGILAQRLVRTLCRHCSIEDNSEETKQEMRPEWLKVLSPKPRKASESGCPHCEYTGYSGRKMVYELLDITPEVRTAIEQNLPPSQISKVGIDESRTLRASGLRLVAKGLTALDEINRLTRKDG